jgi:hypothetical protein
MMTYLDFSTEHKFSGWGSIHKPGVVLSGSLVPPSRARRVAIKLPGEHSLGACLSRGNIC